MNSKRYCLGEFCTQVLPRAAFALALVWNSATYAQLAPTPAPSQLPATQASSPSAAPAQAPPQTQQMPARPLTRIPPCKQYLAPRFEIPSNARPTLFAFRWGLDGDFHDLAIYRSSGSSDLDEAALKCASTVHLHAFEQNGVPIEISWIGGISWNARYPTYFEPNPSGDPNICNARGHQFGRKIIWDTAVVRFAITTDGSVKNPTLVHSVGDEFYDKASIDCVSGYRFFPVTRNGLATEITTTSLICWVER